METLDLSHIRRLAQEHVGTICPGPIYPSEVVWLLDEIELLRAENRSYMERLSRLQRGYDKLLRAAQFDGGSDG